MKEKLINNLGLKILSIFLAFFVWLIVVNVQNPVNRRSREVTLEIENEQVLTAARKTYEIVGKNTVTVNFDVHTRDEYKIRPTDFRAYIDLAELYDVTGSVQVKVEVLNNKELISDTEARPGVIRVKTEELQTKPFELAVDTQGEPADGYALNGVTLSPSYVTVEGPVSQVGLISYAGVEIQIDSEMTGDTQGVVEPTFYDANGNELTISDRIKVNTPEIQYQLLINKVKNLPLDFDVSGTVASGYQYTGVECSTRNVAVIGLKSNLASINRISIPASELNISGATADKVVTVDLRDYLPEGVELAESENPQVEIRIKVERLVNRTVTLTDSDIIRENPSEELRYRLVPNRVEVVIQGLSEDLDSLSGADLEARLDLANLQEGSHTGALRFKTSDVFSVISYSDFSVDVVQANATVVSGSTAEESSPEDESSDSSKEETTSAETPASSEEGGTSDG